MLKFTLSILIVLGLATCSFAAPAYGTRMPGKNKLSLGLQNYTVLKRYLKDGNGKLKSMQEFLLLSYGVFDWLSIDLKGGIGNIKQHPANASMLTYPSYLGGGYGFRVKPYDNNNIKTVFGFQHISIHPHTIYDGSTKHKSVLDDWQFSALASYDFKMLTPYLGAKWSRMDYIHWVDGERKRVKSDLTKSVGLVCGLDIPLGDKFWVNLEGQYFDSTAFSVSANYQF